jgi:hypothetical protein
MESGDFYVITATIGNPAKSSETETAQIDLTSAGPVSFTFYPTWSYAGPAAAKWPSFDLSYTGFTGNAGVCGQTNVYWTANPTTKYEVALFVSGNYLNGSTIATIPDLSGLTGFVPPPASGTSESWNAYVTQGASRCLHAPPMNETGVYVLNSGSFATP